MLYRKALTCLQLLLVLAAADATKDCKPIDLGFLLDESGSIGSTNWPKIVNFTANVVGAFDVASDKTRVSLTKFASTAGVVFHLSKYSTKADVLKNIRSVTFNGGGTSTDAGLKLMRTSVFTSANGDRAAYPNIAVVFTDGKSSNRNRTMEEASSLHKAGVRVVCVAVSEGMSLNEDELKAIASAPVSTNLVIKKSFDQLRDVTTVIRDAVCKLSTQSGCTETELISGSKYRVSDSYLTASSEYGGAGSHGAARSRLNTSDGNGKAGGWCAIPRTTDQWIQVDFRKYMLITSIATQGRNLRLSEWVTSYQLQYSNGGGWRTYTEGGSNKTFSGNSDRDSVVKHKLKIPIYARYFRLNPRTWNNWICLRWELYGCDGSGCYNNGLVSGSSNKVADCQLTASTEYSSGVAHYSRLSANVGYGGWRPTAADTNQWLQVDFKTLVIVAGIATQGGYSSSNTKYGCKASQYYVLYSEDGYDWTTYSESTSPRLFNPGSYGYANSVYKYQISYPFTARYVRLNPRSWYSCITVRWEVYGCQI